MKHLLLAVLLLPACLHAAPRHLIGIKGGVSLTDISGDLYRDVDKKAGMTIGVSYEYLYNKHLSFGADLLYQQRGFTKDFYLTSLTNPISEDKYTLRYNYNYLALPLKGSYTVGKRIFGFASIGVVPAVLINATTVGPSFNLDGTFVEHTKSDVPNVRKFDLGGIAEAGAGIKFKSRYQAYASVGYQHSFMSITTPDYFAGGTMVHRGFMMSLGIKVSLFR